MIIEWLKNKFPTTSVLSELKSDLTDKHAELCERFPDSDLLVNLYLLGNIICQLWGIFRIILIDLDEQYFQHFIDRFKAIKSENQLLLYLPEEYVAELFVIQKLWRKKGISELKIKFKTYLLTLDLFFCHLRIQIVG